MSGKKIIILGALSAIAEATARLYAEQGAELLLVARNEERLKLLAADLRVRGAAKCEACVLDLARQVDIASTFKDLTDRLGGVDKVFLFYGVLGNQHAEEVDLQQAAQSIQVNYTSAAEWCLAAANLLEYQGRGVLVAVSSVAGDRGRQSNYIYGSAKAGLSVLVQGIAHRLAPGGARAVVAKLGFVDTPMTAHIEKKGALWAKPDAVARKLLAVADKPRSPIVYILGFWRLIMLVIRLVPAPIFHKTKL